MLININQIKQHVLKDAEDINEMPYSGRSVAPAK